MAQKLKTPTTGGRSSVWFYSSLAARGLTTFGRTVWESLEAHQALINDKEVYPKLVESLMKGASKIEFMYHATVGDNPFPALDAGVTEIAFWSPHEGTEKKDFEALFVPFITKLMTSPVVEDHAGGWALTHEDDNKYVVIHGWTSVEVRLGHRMFEGGRWALSVHVKDVADDVHFFL